MEESEETDDIAIIEKILTLLKGVTPDERSRILKTISTYFDLGELPASRVDLVQNPSSEPRQEASVRTATSASAFSADRSMSPKEFMLLKQPKSDVERVACLAFYLTHYRDSPYFKTLEISRLNTEAAQIKFSNAAYAVNNALNGGYITAGPKGTRQITAAGERYVLALPDRSKAREDFAKVTSRRPRRSADRSKKPKS